MRRYKKSKLDSYFRSDDITGGSIEKEGELFNVTIYHDGDNWHVHDTKKSPEKAQESLDEFFKELNEGR